MHVGYQRPENPSNVTLLFVVSFLALLAGGCTPSLISIDRSEVQQLKNQPVIYVVNYLPPPLSAMTPEKSFTGAAIGGVIGGLMAVSMAREEGEKLKKELAMVDPSIKLRERVVDMLSTDVELGLNNFRIVPELLESDELDALRNKVGNNLVMDFKTRHWTIWHEPWKSQYYIIYNVQGRLMRLQDAIVMWLGHCRFDEHEAQSTTSTWDELTANSGKLLKTKFDQAAETCAGQLVNQFMGKAAFGNP